jgi:subtilisin family serine protease
VDANGRHLSFANRGEGVDLAAPGLGVAAAGSNNTVISFSGTSAAVPFVSGALAAILAGDAGMGGEAATAILLETCNDTAAPGPDNEVGAGVIDMGRVRNRLTPGIYDVGLAPVYFPDQQVGEQDLSVSVLAQNRGTERLPSVRLEVSIGGQEHDYTFYGVDVGQTVSREYRVPRDALREGPVGITFGAVVDAVTDVNPANNAPRTSVLSLDGGS